MLAEAALLKFFLADPAVGAIAGERGTGAWRVQGSPVPAFTIVRTDGPRDYALDGQTGFLDAYVQIDCYGATALEAKTLAKAIALASGGVNVATTQGVVQGAFVYHEGEEFEGQMPDRVFRSRLNLRTPSNEA